MNDLLIPPALITSALSAQIQATPGCRILCFYHGLGSISQCSNKGVVSARLALAATHMLVRYLSFEFEDALAVGLQLGPFFVGCALFCCMCAFTHTCATQRESERALVQ